MFLYFKIKSFNRQKENDFILKTELENTHAIQQNFIKKAFFLLVKFFIKF